MWVFCMNSPNEPLSTRMRKVVAVVIFFPVGPGLHQISTLISFLPTGLDAHNLIQVKGTALRSTALDGHMQNCR